MSDSALLVPVLKHLLSFIPVINSLIFCHWRDAVYICKAAMPSLSPSGNLEAKVTRAYKIIVLSVILRRGRQGAFCGENFKSEGKNFFSVGENFKSKGNSFFQ